MKKIFIILGFLVLAAVAIIFSQSDIRTPDTKAKGVPQNISSEQVELPPQQLPLSMFRRQDPMPSVTEEPRLTQESSSSDTPDGKKSLTLKSQKTGQSPIYEAYVTETSTGNISQIFSGLKKEFSSIQIPYNTWSPDNLYFFLTDTKSSDATDYLVFQASGEPYDDGIQSINLSEYFKQKVPNYVLQEVTGWAAPYLILINVKNLDGSEGPSFWFDVSTRSFQQLTTKFY